MVDARALATILLGVLSSFCLAGLCFGFSGLYARLVQKGVYGGLCPYGRASTAGSRPPLLNDDRASQFSPRSWSENEHGPAKPYEPCLPQAVALSNMFTQATTLLNAASFFMGVILDKLGPRLSATLASASIGCGCWCFAAGLYETGFSLMAIAGPLIYMCTVSFGNFYPKNAGLITSACVGAFDASSVIFVILATVMTYFSFDEVFWGYGCVPAILLFLCLYPSAPIPAPEPDEDWSPGISPVRSPCSTGQMVLISEEDTDNNGAPYAVGPLPGPGVCASAPSSAERKPSMGGRKASVPLILNSSRVSSRRPSYNYADCSSLVASPKHVDVLGTTNEESDSPTLRSQICSVIFVLLSLTAGTHMLLLNWVISTVPAQMEYLAPADASMFTNFFSVVLPAAGVFAIPIIGPLLDNCGLIPTWFTLWFCMQTAQFLIWDLHAFHIGFALFCFCRPLFYTLLAVSSARLFSPEHFGRVYGLACSIGGLINGCEFLLLDYVKQEGGDYSGVNVCLRVAQLCTVLTPLYLVFQKWLENRKRKSGRSSSKLKLPVFAAFEVAADPKTSLGWAKSDEKTKPLLA